MIGLDTQTALVRRRPLMRSPVVLLLFVAFVLWNAIFVILHLENIIDQDAYALGLLVSPLLLAGCAFLIMKFAEFRVEQHYRREMSRMQRERQEVNLRLAVLQAQLEPHFLFNTLGSLRALLRENAEHAEGLVDALVSHLRAVLPVMRSEDGMSTLSDQLAICVSYLDLMSIRLDGRLTYRIEVPDALSNVLFPPLMLITLVENAVKHGIEPKRGPGLIRITAVRKLVAGSPSIRVSVIDDGVGSSAELGHGLGLKNLREQLTLRYADAADLSLTFAPEGGALASILIPEQYVAAP